MKSRGMKLNNREREREEEEEGKKGRRKRREVEEEKVNDVISDPQLKRYLLPFMIPVFFLLQFFSPSFSISFSPISLFLFFLLELIFSPSSNSLPSHSRVNCVIELVF